MTSDAIMDRMVQAFGEAWQACDTMGQSAAPGARRKAGIQAVLSILDEEIAKVFPDVAPLAVDELSAYPHVLGRVDFTAPFRTEDPPVDNPADANVITSTIADGPFKGRHTVMLDLDVPARLVPSTTPGHSHLYIDVAVDWAAYDRLLGALCEAGVIEQGYYAASQTREHTTLRLPSVAKQPGDVSTYGS